MPRAAAFCARQSNEHEGRIVVDAGRDAGHMFWVFAVLARPDGIIRVVSIRWLEVGVEDGNLVM